MDRRTFASALAGAATLAVLPGTASSQETWPARPIRLVVPQATGGGGDIVGRVFAEQLGAALKQPVLVDNRGGANGMLGTQQVKAAAPDGYTLLFTYAAAQVVNPSLYEKAGYDGVRDFAAIAQIGAGGNLLVVPASFPATDLKQFVAHVRARPADELAYGSWGVGSGGHLSMEALKQQTGLKLRHVPYKSSGASNQDLVAGHIQAGFTSVQAGIPLIQAGKLKALAISGTTRTVALPDLATMTEQGVPFDVDAWYGVFAPAGTPRPIVERLNREINRIIADPANQERWKVMGFSTMPLRSPDEFAEQVRADVRTWGEVVKRGNIRPDD